MQRKGDPIASIAIVRLCYINSQVIYLFAAKYINRLTATCSRPCIRKSVIWMLSLYSRFPTIRSMVPYLSLLFYEITKKYQINIEGTFCLCE